MPANSGDLTRRTFLKLAIAAPVLLGPTARLAAIPHRPAPTPTLHTRGTYAGWSTPGVPSSGINLLHGRNR